MTDFPNQDNSPVDSCTGINDKAVAVSLLVACFIATLACTILSGDAYYHLDDVTHFLFARWSWQWPEYLINDWGRPGFTTPYATVAPLGLMAAKILSTVLSAAAAWFAYLTARKIGITRAWLAILLAFAQPVFFQLAQTTLTETPLAFYLALASWLAVHRRWRTSFVVLSISFVTRHEAVIFAPVFAYFAYRERVRFTAFTYLLLAPAAINLTSAICGMGFPMLRFLEPQPTRQYGEGGWLTYFTRALHAWGPTVTILAMIGWRSLSKLRGGALIAWTVLAYFLAQTIVFKFGLFASGGYSRFLIGASPLTAIAATVGVNLLMDTRSTVWKKATIGAAISMVVLWLSMERQIILQKGIDIELPVLHHAKLAIRIAAGAMVFLASIAILISQRGRMHIVARSLIPAALVVLLILTVYAFYRPLPQKPDARLIDDLLVELRHHGLGDREIISAHPYLDYRQERDKPYDAPPIHIQIERAPMGTLIAWERKVAGGEDHGLDLESLSLNRAFKKIMETPPLPYQDAPYMRIFEKIGDWSSSPPKEKVSQD